MVRICMNCGRINVITYMDGTYRWIKSCPIHGELFMVKGKRLYGWWINFRLWLNVIFGRKLKKMVGERTPFSGSDVIPLDLSLKPKLPENAPLRTVGLDGKIMGGHDERED